MKTIHKIRYLVIGILASYLSFSSCSSSKDEPIAETFIGEWDIYEKRIPNASNNELVEGNLLVSFETNSVVYKLRIHDPDNPLNLAGIVWDNNLHNDMSKEITYATLFLDNSNEALRIEYDYLDRKVTYYAIQAVKNSN